MAAERKDKRSSSRRWYIDMGTSSGHSIVKSSELPTPHSYIKHGAVEQSQKDQTVDKELLVKRSWDVALGPIKQVPMNMFVMWMAGSSISIFPIMMVGMMAVRPIQAFFNLSQTFKMIEGDQAPLQKLTFIFGNLVGIALAVYKCNSMGLLPTHASDWLAFAEPVQRLEYAAGGISLQ